MADSKSDRSVACRLGVVSREVTANTARLLATYQVSAPQANVLYHLAHSEHSPSAIAELMGVDASHVTRVARVLEDRGAVARTVDPKNRRRVALALTRQGRALEKRIDPHAELIQEAITAALGPRGVRQFLAYLDKISDALGALPDDAVAQVLAGRAP